MKRIFVNLFLLLWGMQAFAQIAAVDVDQGTEETEVEDIIIVFKMHFDIGFTEWAESVLQKYTTTMIDETLNSVERTAQLPKEEQFVWTLPGWPMKYILENTNPKRKARVEDALRKGRLAPHALPFTLQTESSDLETLVRGMSYTSQIDRAYNLPLTRSAKMTDVPSHSWIMPTLLTRAGVKILHIGCNAGSGSPDVPTLFWWEGPDGSRLLTFNWAEYYGSGVMPPTTWKYKTWLAMIHTHENTGAPSPEAVAAVLKEAKQKMPKANVRIGQLEDFYDAVMKENPNLPVVRGDMPDTWIHGFMSMPREVKIDKAMQRTIYNAEALNTQLRNWNVPVEPAKPYVDQAIEQGLLFNEHTFGLALSHGHQGFWKYDDSFFKDRVAGAYDFIEESWYEKGLHAHRSQESVVPVLRRDLMKLANTVRVNGKKVVVYNPLPWKRSGNVSFFMDVYKKGFTVTGLKDEVTGEVIPAYNDGKNLCYLSFEAKDLPSFGYKTYSVVTEALDFRSNSLRVDTVEGILENQYFRLTLNRENGSLLSVWDKKRQKEMVDQKNEFGFGEYFNEKFGLEEIRRFTTANIKPGHHGWADAEHTRPEDPDLKYKKVKGKASKIEYDKQMYAISVTAYCRTDLGEDYLMTYKLYENQPYLEMNWGIKNKQADMQPEGCWLAFPFNVEQPSFKLGRLGAVEDPATDFVKNTSHDYYFVNTGLAVVGKDKGGFGLNTPNAPAVSLDRPGLFRFSGKFAPQRPNVFVNLYNNEWGCNFTEWVDGFFSAKFYVWSIADYDNESSLITPVEETRVPLVAIYTESPAGTLPVSEAGVQLSRKGVLVTAFGKNTDGEGDLLRLWEQAGVSGDVTVSLPSGMKVTQAVPVNLRGEVVGTPLTIQSGKLKLKLEAYAPASVILK